VWSAVAILAVMGVALYAMGQPFWCAGGEPWLWSAEVWSRHNSQHLFDPYTLSHVSHGIVLAVLLRAVLPAPMYRRRGLVVAIALEAAWELFENTDLVIRRYRATTMSLDYFGDSVANSIGDVLAMLVGYVAAARASTWVAAAAFVSLEVGLALWIRDGVLLNVLMLVAPAEAVKTWQLGGAPGAAPSPY
jgi:uncharacterized protein DUF2585